MIYNRYIIYILGLKYCNHANRHNYRQIKILIIPNKVITIIFKYPCTYQTFKRSDT